MATRSHTSLFASFFLVPVERPFPGFAGASTRGDAVTLWSLPSTRRIKIVLVLGKWVLG
jgi:hypothetical protein